MEEEICKTIEQSIREACVALEAIEDKVVEEMIDAAIIQQAKNQHLSLQQKLRIRERVFHSVRGYDCLEELFQMEDVTEIMINGYDSIFIERHGKLVQWDQKFSSLEKYMDVIQQVVAGCNRIVNERTPIVDARLKDGSRVNIVLPPIALDGAVMTIRRFPSNTYGMKDLVNMGMLSEEMAEDLRVLVESKYNVLVSGGTGSGKTTFLNALSNYIPPTERIITIEDSAELQIRGIPNLVRLEVRNANVEGKNEITIKELIRSALRMRPDRIIVGEVRGEEAVDMLQAMNTGHNGSLSTGHANSAKDMIYRLETMVLMGMDIPLKAIRQQIASAIDILVHIGRLPDGSRRVLEVSEVLGCENGEVRLHTIYVMEENLLKNTKQICWRRLENFVNVEKAKTMGKKLAIT